MVEFSMNLSVGIVGLPNVGKSTLFNALLKKQIADVAPYPFCTIEPNKGIVAVPDGRLPVLAKIIKTSRVVPAVVEFVDIAGLIKGAAQGEGLGNQFLSHIRNVSLICHVVRFFQDPKVTHVGKKVDPLEDVEVVNSELILADLQTLKKQKKPKGKANREEEVFWEAVEILKKEMNRGKLAQDVSLTEEQQEAVKRLFLLTTKPVIYVANMDEEQLEKREELLKNFVFRPVIPLAAKMEFDLLALTKEEQQEYLRQYQLSESGLERLIRLAYETLGLISFLTTTGGKEVRAWPIKKGTKAKEAAGVVHSDFERNFIKAEVVSFEDFVQYGGWQAARAAGKVRLEGKEYQIKDGEVIEFKSGG